MNDNEICNSIEQIAATIAHEIRNPITLIKSSLQLLELDDKNSEHKKSYNIVYRELDRINNLVSDFINFSNPLQLNFTNFKLDLLISEVLDTFSAIFKKKKINIVYNKSSLPLNIIGDYIRLKQVLINIIKNAVEASLENGIITITEIETDNYFGVTIIDNGVGIDSDIVQKIGMPYFTTKENGTGLGIALSKEIIEKHKGSLSISSLENHGTCVTILLKNRED